MSKLQVGDKLVFQPDCGRFKHLEDPPWIVKLIVAGMSFGMGSPEETLSGQWQCPGLTEAQARIVAEMVGIFCGLKVARCYEDADEGGLVFIFEKGRRQERYRSEDWFFYGYLGSPAFAHTRQTGWLEEWSPINSWNCPGLSSAQVALISEMAAALLGCRVNVWSSDQDDLSSHYEFVPLHH